MSAWLIERRAEDAPEPPPTVNLPQDSARIPRSGAPNPAAAILAPEPQKDAPFKLSHSSSSKMSFSEALSSSNCGIASLSMSDGNDFFGAGQELGRRQAKMAFEIALQDQYRCSALATLKEGWQSGLMRRS